MLPVASTSASYGSRERSASSTSRSSRWISTTRASSRRSTWSASRAPGVDGSWVPSRTAESRIRLYGACASSPSSVTRGRQPSASRAAAPCRPDDDDPVHARTAAAQTLNSGIRLDGSRASLVSRLAPTQWNGTKTVSGRIVRDDPGRRLELAAPGRDHDGLAVAGADPVGQHRVQLDERAGVGQVADPPGLGAGLVLREHPAGGEVDRELVVGRLGRAAVVDGDEPGPAVGVRERSANSRGVPGVLGVRARPEHAVLGPDPVVGDARRSRRGRPDGGPGQLGEDLLGVGGERHRRADPLGERGDHVEVRADAGRAAGRPAGAGSPGPRGWSWCRSPRPTG